MPVDSSTSGIQPRKGSTRKNLSNRAAYWMRYWIFADVTTHPALWYPTAKRQGKFKTRRVTVNHTSHSERIDLRRCSPISRVNLDAIRIRGDVGVSPWETTVCARSLFPVPHHVDAATLSLVSLLDFSRWLSPSMEILSDVGVSTLLRESSYAVSINFLVSPTV